MREDRNTVALKELCREAAGNAGKVLHLGDISEAYSWTQVEEDDVLHDLAQKNYIRFLGGGVFQLTHAGIVSAENLMPDDEDVKHRRKIRLQLLKSVHGLSAGESGKQIDLEIVADAAGISPKDNDTAYMYLTGAGLLKPYGAGYYIIMTPEGRKVIEDMAGKNDTISLFYSYAHEDEGLRDQLNKHLSGLRRGGAITEWHDREIIAGSELHGEIDQHLNDAQIILLLVSPDFMHSDYCWDREVMRAMERHKAGEARVIPVVLRDCDWSDAPFKDLLALPKDARPVTGSHWKTHDEAFLDITKGIRAAVDKIRTSSGTSKLSSVRAERSNTSSSSAAQIAMTAGVSTAKGLVRDVLDTLWRDIQSYTIDTSAVTRAELDEKQFEKLASWTPFRDSYAEFIHSALRSGQETLIGEALPKFFGRLLPSFHTDSQDGDKYQSHLNFIVYELFIYTCAVMIEEDSAESYAALGSLLSSSYKSPRYADRDAPFVRFPIFRPSDYSQLLKAKERVDREYLSPYGQILSERATWGKLSFASICQADCFLLLRDALDRNGSKREGSSRYTWQAYTWPYVFDEFYESNNNGGLEFLILLQSRACLEKMQIALGVTGAEELRSKWDATYKPDPESLRPNYRSALADFIDQNISKAATSN